MEQEKISQPDFGTIIAKPETTTQTKVCKCCGKELPITEFGKYAGGYRKICKMCQRENLGVSERFKEFTSRDLIDELKARGYTGVLTKKIVQTYNL